MGECKGKTKATKHNQAERILNYLKDFGSITQYDAMRDLGIMRLGARIWELKHSGFNIKSEYITVKNRYGDNCYVKSYSIAE